MRSNWKGYVREFVSAYVECALWSSTDESDDSGGEPLDNNFGPEDLTDTALESMRADCAQFIRSNRDDLAALDARQSGHDFWLTRNEHGAGFWNRGLGAVGDRLTKDCTAWGEVNLYVGDDGRIHVY